MFTGIIEQLATVNKLTSKANLLVLTLNLGKLIAQVKPGDSVSVNGVCLTVTRIRNTSCDFDLMKETIDKTSLQGIDKGSKVNVELALKINSRFGGHFVTGHVDELAKIKSISRAKNYVAVTVGVSTGLRKHLVPKGSVTIDGISLTVGKVGKNDFMVHLIPFTLKSTNLGERKVGDVVNIETDILAKYIMSRS